MRIKTFNARTMAEALGEVKRHFGPHAVILNTRSEVKGGWLGIGGRPYVEITAARGGSDLPEPLRRGSISLRSRSQRPGRAEGAAGPVQNADASSQDGLSDTLLSEVGSLKSLVQELVTQSRRSALGKQPGQLYDTYTALIENCVAEELASNLVEHVAGELSASQLSNPRSVRAKLLEAVGAMVPTSGPIGLGRAGKPSIVALVGPTGVGKTTTIAKLAANFCLREHRKVGLVTIDSYRIAAIEQLKTYAHIIDVPLEVATSPEQLKDVIARLKDRDCILIDTAGRSQRDDMKIRELRGFFNAVRPHEVHLVLSSVCSEKVLLDAVEKFRGVGIDRVIFTKLDEAVGFGVMLKCLEKAQAKLSYVTTGQDVPEDIELGRRDQLARLVVGDAEVPHERGVDRATTVRRSAARGALPAAIANA